MAMAPAARYAAAALTMHEGLGLQDRFGRDRKVLEGLLDAAPAIPRLRTFRGSTTVEACRTPEGVVLRRLVEPMTGDAQAVLARPVAISDEAWRHRLSDHVLLIPRLAVLHLDLRFDADADALRELFGADGVRVHQLEAVERELRSTSKELDPDLGHARRLLSFCRAHQLLVRIRA